jgi:rubrerythrin
MSYTTNGAPQGDPIFKTNMVQEAMIGELVAINEYANHIAESSIAEINDVWEHIMKDEKKHYGMLLELLRKYDRVQMQKYNDVKEHLDLHGRELSSSNSRNTTSQILNNIRKDIKGELEAIILYESHIVRFSSTEMKEVFTEIVNDEKEHVEELTAVLLRYDPDKYGPIDQD